jgi:UDP-glucose 4-epimerase
MKIMVTGGAGFIGSHVVDVLIDAGHEVVVVDSLWERGGGKMEHVNPKARFYKVDVRDKALNEVFEKERPHMICHHAAQHSVKISVEDPVHDADVNILGLINLLNCATRFKTQKIIFASSGATYGVVGHMPIREDTPQRPVSPYGITKMATEHYLRVWKDIYDLDYTLLRYGNVYGPRQDPKGEAGVIAIFASAILNNQSLRIDWDGEQQKDYVFVRDVAQANLLALERGAGEAFCIATEQEVSVNTLYRSLANIIGHEVEIIRAPKRPGDIYLTYFDCSKAHQQLGWQAKVSMPEGLRLTVDYFRSGRV